MALNTSVTAVLSFTRVQHQDGRLLGKSSLRHTSVEFVAFLTDIVTNQPNDKEIHVIARGFFTSLSDLKRTLMRYIRHDNMQPKPVK